MVVEKDPFTACLVTNVSNAGGLASEDVPEQRFKAAEARALVQACTDRQTVLLELVRVYDSWLALYLVSGHVSDELRRLYVTMGATLQN